MRGACWRQRLGEIIAELDQTDADWMQSTPSSGHHLDDRRGPLSWELHKLVQAGIRLSIDIVGRQVPTDADHQDLIAGVLPIPPRA